MRGTTKLALAGLIFCSSTAIWACPSKAIDPVQMRTNSLGETNRFGQEERFNTQNTDRLNNRTGSNAVRYRGPHANLYRTPNTTVLRTPNEYYLRHGRSMHRFERYGSINQPHTTLHRMY